MKRTLVLLGLFALLALSAISATQVSLAQSGRGMHGDDFWQPGWMHRDMWRHRGASPEMRARMQRHWTFMHVGVPRQYENARSTITHSPGTIAHGGKLYSEHCASCHGANGLGDGEAGKSLTPSPALLAYMIQRPIAVDEYLLWTVSEGGVSLRTEMPAFKDVLTQDEIWKIVAYMRMGFGPVKAPQ